MGYCAPSAEQVYRYALRLDNTKRKLTDRFNFSIIFVNDTSEICKDFLQKYCIDLCFRTADRIRFIFFSELSIQEINAIIQKMYNGGHHASKGILGNILERLDLFRNTRRKYDYEDEFWKELRPKSLLPLHNLEDIKGKLNWECDMNTAMPGSGMAMQFAQRLGIGKHVPCFVIFTDIGQFHVDLMEIVGLSIDEIYKHLRYWIDEYYEKNHYKIEKWRKIEDEIEEIGKKINSSISEIENLHYQVNSKWETLKSISKIIYQFEMQNKSEWIEILEISKNDYSFSYEMRTALKGFFEEINQIGKIESIIVGLKNIIFKISKIEDCEQLFNELKNIKKYDFKLIGIHRPNSIELGIGELWNRIEILKGPYNELNTWWIHSAKARLSYNEFKQNRQKWLKKYYNIYNNESQKAFKTIQNTINKLPLSTEPQEGAKMAINNLAKHYLIDIASQDWEEVTVPYYNYLVSYINAITSTAPSWFIKEYSNLTIEEILPSPEKEEYKNFDEYLKSKPQLHELINKGSEQNSNYYDIVRQENNILAANILKTIIIDIESLIEAYKLQTKDWDYIGKVILGQLRQYQNKSEIDLYNQIRKNVKVSYSPIENKLIDRLLSALDEYDQVVDSIDYPHKQDPLIHTVKIENNILNILDLKEDKILYRTNPTLTYKKYISDNLAKEMESIKKINNIESDLVVYSPKNSFYKSVTTCINENRLDELLSPFQGKTKIQKIESIINNYRIIELLELLNERELNSVFAYYNLQKDNSKIINFYLNQNQMILFILCQLGLFKVKTDSKSLKKTNCLNRKIVDNNFDVFMAHNSKDKKVIYKIYNLLLDKGIYPWLDNEEIAPGKWFQDVIQNVIPKVKSAAIFIGKYGIGKWQLLEIRSFITQCLERNIPVIPILLPEVEKIPEELSFLRELNYVKFENSYDEEMPLNKLIWGITGTKIK